MITDQQMLALRMGLKHELGGVAADYQIVRTAADPRMLHIVLPDGLTLYLAWHPHLTAAEVVARFRGVLAAAD